jgi:hypothetical protein
MWSDPNLSPFMAVTAHWIEANMTNTPQGSQQILKLQADLVGFCQVPGHHTGAHMATVFLHIMDRLDIQKKVCLIGFMY